ncbi:hypothetical protein [Thermococcus sp. 21S7]|uniref:hypothetical protein n=1 Tax=Thermococcus sp. 21S7 TaxID=1638221 RepID=UPI00143C87BC|nr:hypothetical protein [Thermococcus sp. 21S7]NJE60630.1 hypothetical protein [Thermococcus sp. 21S7]
MEPLKAGGAVMNETVSKTDAFLKNNGVWEGEFSNYVNQMEGITQRGKMIIEVEATPGGTIIQRNFFVRPDGTKSDYVGIARMRLDGNRLLWVGEEAEDPNTAEEIRNHSFEGIVTEDQIYIVELYEAVGKDGTIERRRNTTHYYFLSDKEAVMTGSVYVNDELLVFASTRLRRVR